jgi:hypothetical protein
MKSDAGRADHATMRRSKTAGATAIRGGGSDAPSRRDAQPEAPLRFERRGSGRSRVRGEGVATFVEPEGQLWLARVHLVDRSEAGLGVRAAVPVRPGATFVLSLDGAVVHGRVAHSRGRGGAYRLGLRCAARAAA